MALDKYIQFFIKYNAVLIEALVGVIIITVGFIAYRNFASARDEAGGAKGGDLHEIEEMMKKLLEKANQVPTAASLVKAGADGSVDTTPLLNEIEKLKIDLQTKQSEIEQMKSAPVAAGAPAAGISTEEKTALEGQIKELQNKLAEYEIISEDIADLSFYKEENAKLRKQIEGGGSAPAPAPAPAAAAPAPAPTPAPEPEPVAPPPAGASAEPAIVGKSSFTPAAEPAPVAPPADPTPAPAATSTDNLIDDDLMKEFAMAVQEQKAAVETASSAAPASAPTPAAEPAPAPAPVAAAPEASAEPSVDLGSLDIDKMMTEAGSIDETSIAAAPSAEEVLSQELDPEKLALEADNLNNVKPEDKVLMGQFENFVKKENQ